MAHARHRLATLAGTAGSRKGRAVRGSCSDQRAGRRLGGMASALLVLVVVAGCGTASPTLSGSPAASRTPVPAADRGQPPPLALQQTMRAGMAVFEPLSEAELAMIAVSVSEAQAAALEVGGPDQAHYTRVGFVYLGRWVPPLESLGNAPVPDPIPAYLVQLFADPSPAFPVERAPTCRWMREPGSRSSRMPRVGARHAQPNSESAFRARKGTARRLPVPRTGAGSGPHPIRRESPGGSRDLASAEPRATPCREPCHPLL
jgi:hypothetical protein